jgi:hypothetical protein
VRGLRLLAFVICSVGCGSGGASQDGGAGVESAQELQVCHDWAGSACAVFLNCQTPQNPYPLTLDQCLAKLSAQCSTPPDAGEQMTAGYASCPSGRQVDMAVASQCIGALQDYSCPDLDKYGLPASCSAVCTDGGDS